MLAVVGALVFTQYWYWFPLAHCLALAFTPTCLIALNSQLKMPKLEVRSNARPSVYAYPAPLEEKKREEREKVTTAVLSIAARARRRESERRARSPMRWNRMDVVSIYIYINSPAFCSEVRLRYLSAIHRLFFFEIFNLFVFIFFFSFYQDQTSTEAKESGEVKESAVSTSSGIKEKEEKKKDSKDSKEKEKKAKDEDKEKIEKEKKEPEPSFEILQNPARILRQQLKVVQLVDGSQYAPVKDIQIGGIVMVKHIKSDSEEELVEPVVGKLPFHYFIYQLYS